MTAHQIEITDQKEIKSRNTKIIQYCLDITVPTPLTTKWIWDIVIGIDPGDKNMGLTILPTHASNQVQCFEISFPSERLAIPRLVQIRLALLDIMSPILHSRAHYRMMIALEGSAYSRRYRNTELAEARIVAAEWFMDNFDLTADDFIIITPQSIRKTVFGSAKIKAETQWPQLKGDAASSLAIALAGLTLKTM